MVTLITFVGLCCATYLFAEGAEPVQELKHFAGLGAESPFRNPVQWFFLKMLGCSMCVGFWVGLGYYQHLLSACILSIGAEALSRIMNKTR